MGTDIAFLLEQRTAYGWEPAVDLLAQIPDATTNTYVQDNIVAEVCWWSAKRDLTSLFLGQQAPLKLNPGLPEDASSAVRVHCEINFQTNDSLSGWIDVTDLMIDQWHELTVYLRCKCPIEYAALFANGERSQSEVEDAIEKVDIAPKIREQLLSILNERHLSNAPIDRRGLEYQKHQYPDRSTPVTWTVPISEFARWIYPQMLAVQQLSRRHELRLVTAIG